MTAGKSGAGPEPMDTTCAQELVAHTKQLEDVRPDPCIHSQRCTLDLHACCV